MLDPTFKVGQVLPGPGLRAPTGGPVALLVVSTDQDIAAWMVSHDLTLLDSTSDDQVDLSSTARELILELPTGLQDDRYLGSLPETMTAAAIVRDAAGVTVPVAFVGGSVSRGRLQLDILAQRNPAPDAELTRTAIQVLVNHVTDHVQRSTDSDPPLELELWTRPDQEHVAVGPQELGMGRHRSLNQLRVELPVTTVSAIHTRSFDQARDLENLVTVNNRAFADHPDQGQQSIDNFRRLLDEEGFDPAGLRVLDDPNGGDTMAGFCWTKIHPVGNYHPTRTDAGPADRVGEIFVIGLDPAFHGRRLGVPLVAAGLEWLASQGMQEALLFVEADNEPALRTYERLGFVRNRVDTAWRLAP